MFELPLSWQIIIIHVGCKRGQYKFNKLVTRMQFSLSHISLGCPLRKCMLCLQKKGSRERFIVYNCIPLLEKERKKNKIIYNFERVIQCYYLMIVKWTRASLSLESLDIAWRSLRNIISCHHFICKFLFIYL